LFELGLPPARETNLVTHGEEIASWRAGLDMLSQKLKILADQRVIQTRRRGR
jgi:hypothetical protein